MKMKNENVIYTLMKLVMCIALVETTGRSVQW